MVTNCNYLLFFYGRTSRELAEKEPGHPLFKLQLHYSGDFLKKLQNHQLQQIEIHKVMLVKMLFR